MVKEKLVIFVDMNQRRIAFGVQEMVLFVLLTNKSKMRSVPSAKVETVDVEDATPTLKDLLNGKAMN